MLTKNAYALIFGLMNKSDSVRMTDITGTKKWVQISVNNYANVDAWDAFKTFYASWNSGAIYSSGLYFGTGGTAPSVNDYTLSGNFLKDSVGYKSTRDTLSQEDGYTELQATLAVYNSGDNDVTISEIGLFGYLRDVNNSSNAYLMDRIVLATPITIPAGGTKSITYNLRHTY